MDKKILKTHEKILNDLIAKCSKAHDAGDLDTVKQCEMDIVVTAATTEMWQNIINSNNS